MQKLKSVEEYGRLYQKRFLEQPIAQKDLLLNDWNKALEFMFHKTFYRGRKDELSERFMNATLKTLEQHKPTKNYNPSLLSKQLLENGVNNGTDRRMVLEVLNFIFKQLDDYENNVVKYTVQKIKTGKTKEVFEALNNIYAIGDKLASFYLRDIILVYGLEKSLQQGDFQYCQPIDTWVKQVAVKLGILPSQDTSIEESKKLITEACHKADISPLLFNAGAWMVGARSFELLVETL